MTDGVRENGTREAGPGPAGDAPEVEAILPLLPNQRALLLYRELRSPHDPGFLQVRFTVDGSLDMERFARSWEAALHRHPGLRATINQRDDGDPLLVVWRSPAVPISVEDWRGAAEDEQATRLERLLAADRERGLDPAAAPAMRLTLARTQDERYEAVWSCHHLFVDGWSSAVVLEDVLSLYAQGPAATAPPQPSEGFRDYMGWALDRDDGAAQLYWSELLSGYRPLPRFDFAGPAFEAADEDFTVRIDEAVTKQIADFVVAENLTPNAVAQGAWSLALGALFDTDDVVFGTTVAGRSAPIEGIERLVGYISNAVPIRMRIPKDDSVADWLTAARNTQFAGQAHEAASLADIQAWSGVPGHQPLFETFLIVENFPEVANGIATDISISGFQSGLTTAYPLTIAVVPGTPWTIHTRFDGRRCSPDAAAAIIELFVDAAGAITKVPGRRVGEAVADVVQSGPVLAPDEVGQGDRTAFRAAGTPVEKLLVGAWSDVLDLSPVGVDDDFFDIGGSSVLAVVLMDRIEERTGRRLPLSTLIAAPTISKQAQLISGEMPSEKSSVVPVRSSGSRPPLFVVPGAGGTALAFRDLGELLSPDQPLLAFEPLGHDGATVPHQSIEEMAERYVADMLEQQPQGPYRIGGSCLGGTVAWEMANQLRRQGAAVDRVLVLDGRAPANGPTWEIVSKRARTPLQKLSAVFRHLRRGSLLGAVRSIRRRQDRADVQASHERARVKYVAKPLDVDVVLIQSSEHAEEPEILDRWQSLAKRVHRDVIPDTQHTEALDDLDQLRRMADIIDIQLSNSDS